MFWIRRQAQSPPFQEPVTKLSAEPSSEGARRSSYRRSRIPDFSYFVVQGLQVLQRGEVLRWKIISCLFLLRFVDRQVQQSDSSFERRARSSQVKDEFSLCCSERKTDGFQKMIESNSKCPSCKSNSRQVLHGNGRHRPTWEVSRRGSLSARPKAFDWRKYWNTFNQRKFGWETSEIRSYGN